MGILPQDVLQVVGSDALNVERANLPIALYERKHGLLVAARQVSPPPVIYGIPRKCPAGRTLVDGRQAGHLTRFTARKRPLVFDCFPLAGEQ